MALVDVYKRQRKIPAETILAAFAAGPDENMAYFSPKPDGYSLLYSPDETGYRGAWLTDVHVMIDVYKRQPRNTLTA